jgi:hypothetical protein
MDTVEQYSYNESTIGRNLENKNVVFADFSSPKKIKQHAVILVLEAL